MSWVRVGVRADAAGRVPRYSCVHPLPARMRGVRGHTVMPQEEVFQRGRLADQAAHAGLPEDPDEFTEAGAVDLRVQGGAVEAGVLDAGYPGEIARVAEQFG